MTAQDQQSRAEFEKAMRAEPNHWVNRDFYRDPLGVDLYEDRGTQAAWSAWQAARALPAGMEPLCYLRPAAATTPARAWQAWENDGTAEPVYTAAQVRAIGRVLPEPTNKQIVLMAGAILHQAHGTADTRHPAWAQAVEQAERAYRALVLA